MPGSEREHDAGSKGPDGTEGLEAAVPAGPDAPGPTPHWTSLVRLDPSAVPPASGPEQRAMLMRLQRSAGNAQVARLLGTLAPPELKAARQAARTTAPSAAGARSQAPGGALLVGDDAAGAGAGRMAVGAFLDAVEGAVTEVAARELGPVFQVVGCPWVEHWITYYRQREPGEVEAAVTRYAPAAAGARTAHQYIDLVVARVQEGIAVWRKTGQVPDVPDGSPGAPAGGTAVGDSSASPAFRLRDGQPRPAAGAGALGGRLGAGETIDRATSGAVGASYGTDLSAVRIHRDTAAAQVVGSLGARAVTVGRDIAFAPGQYAPGTVLGDALIAHELAHVVQQTSGGAATADTQSLEKDADQAARSAIAARWGLGDDRSARRPVRSTDALRPQSCINPTDDGAIFDQEAEEFAKKASIRLHRVPEADDKPAPVGFRPQFWLEAPLAAGEQGTVPLNHVKSWHVQEPGSADVLRRSTPHGQRFSVEMDKVGTWIVYAKLEIDGQIAYLVRRQEIVAADPLADEAFKRSGTSSYVNYRTLMNQERLTRTGGIDLDQSKVAGASITNEGPGAENPSPIRGDLSSYRYAVHPNPKSPPDRQPATYRWWAIPRATDMNQFSARTDLGRRTDYQGEFAFYLGEGTSQTFSRGTPGTIEIVCELIDATGKRVDTARYRQLILRAPQLEQVRQVDKLMKEGAQNYRKIRPGRARGLKAMHLDARRGKSSDLTLFFGPHADDPSVTMLVDLTPGAEYVEHAGATLESAIKHLEDNNSYGTGQILIHSDGPPAIDKRLRTSGETDFQDAAQKTGIGGMVLAGLGIIAAFTPLAFAAPYLIAGGLGIGAVSGGLSVADELRKARPSGLKIALDVASVVGSLAGAAGMAQAIRVGSVELAMATAAGRFFIYTGFAFDVTGGVLLAADTAEKIEQIRKSSMSDEQKIDAIQKLILNLIVVGGFIAFGARDVGAAKKRLVDLVGEERVRPLRPETLYTLQALDDATLQALKRIGVDEFEAVAVALSKDPKRSAALSKAFGEKFVDEVRANPSRSLEETGEILGARAAGAPAGPVGGTRGPDVYQTDPARGIGAKGESAKKRFERGVNSAREGRIQGVAIDKSAITMGDRKATIDMAVGGETVTVTVELRPTGDLAQGAHAGTGGAGSGRIVELVPPSATNPKWTATVQLDDALLQENVRFALGHELDEIADFVQTKGTAGMASLAGEMEAGIFVTWAKRGSKTPPKATSHDRANAPEFLSVAADVRALEIELKKKPGDTALGERLQRRQETLKRLTLNMGLLDPANIELKLAQLRRTLDGLDPSIKGLLMTAPPGGTSPWDALVAKVHKGVSTTDVTSVLSGLPGDKVEITAELLEHALRAKPRSRGDFLKSGINGGHYDQNLREFVAANPEYALVHKHQADSGFATYRHYEQYRWRVESGLPAPPPGSPGYPGGKGPIDANWEKAVGLPKTTFDEPLSFMYDADRLIKAWKGKLTDAELSQPMTGPKVVGTDPGVMMHFTYEPPPINPATNAPDLTKPGKWEIRSIFIDEQWIAAAQAAAATPTPPPAGVTK